MYQCCVLGGLPVLWFFPYFMEHRILGATSGFSMLDYKVILFPIVKKRNRNYHAVSDLNISTENVVHLRKMYYDLKIHVCIQQMFGETYWESLIVSVVLKFNFVFQVEYTNHDEYGETHKQRKHGSPVRIFTNIDPSKIKLPEQEGYRYITFYGLPL